jgi:peptide/nickel transport system permease protein
MTEVVRGETRWPAGSPTIERLMSHPTFLVGAGALLLVIAAVVAGLLLSPYDPHAISFRARLQPPGAEHWFGTDNLGRDVATRMAYGAAISFEVGLLVALLNGLAGTLLGTLAGYYRVLDGAIMRVMDAL